MSLKIMFCLRRQPILTRAEFQRYWREDHAALVRRFATETGMTRYVQCHTVETRMSRAFAEVRDTAEAFDGVMEGWWESEAAAIAILKLSGPEVGEALIRDERTFIDLKRSHIFFVEEHRIF